ncbi:LOW QUALITY PROTEIN: reelin domain-containing protein 1 [Mus pahari]|uniref:LOW QUALITY PROTEIN: reelin domain-containing protein 1 n=1 Tax=Mus pahari TaxID=10093 RepID=UPI001114FB5D|nr:LOW QUALITY PROTEIN: reelin domain-containing protein 1 [Mus pahari]
MRILAVLASWTCATLTLASCLAAFSHGSSTQAWEDMWPRHTQTESKHPGSHHITIHTSRPSYLPGAKIPVSVQSSRDATGFLLRAHSAAGHQIVGTFVFTPRHSKLMTCSGETDTATHSDDTPKRTLLFMWKALAQPVGDIRFLNGQQLSREINPILQLSLDVYKLEMLVTLRKGSLDRDVSILSTHHRSQNDLSFDSLETCLPLDKGEQDKMTASNRSVMGPAPHTARIPEPQQVWSHSQGAECGGDTAEGGMGYLSKTDLRPEVMQLRTPQLEIPICLSVTLGVALAAGFSFLCPQYCHKQTEVSSSEPTVDAVGDGDRRAGAADVGLPSVYSDEGRVASSSWQACCILSKVRLKMTNHYLAYLGKKASLMKTICSPDFVKLVWFDKGCTGTA